MGKLSLYLISGVLILSPGYCSSAQEREQPTAPEKVTGWKDIYSDGVHSIAEFMDIIKPQTGAEGYAGMKKVVLRFYSAVDKRTLCEATFTKGGTALGNGPPYPHCKPEVGLSAISVNAINTKDNWVWFDLRK